MHDASDGRLMDVKKQRRVDVDADIASQPSPRHTQVVPRRLDY